MDNETFKLKLTELSNWNYSYLNRPGQARKNLNETNAFPVVKQLNCRMGCVKCNAQTETPPIFTYNRIFGDWRGKCSICKKKV